MKESSAREGSGLKKVEGGNGGFWDSKKVAWGSLVMWREYAGLLVFWRPQNSDFKKVEGGTVIRGIVLLGKVIVKKVEGTIVV